MLAGYQAGITPNPDIMCNQEVKFKLFLEAALADGADMIATGHYARVVRDDAVASVHTTAALYVGVDANKDQSYFLYRATAEALGRTLMPIGEYEKPAVRELARKFGLSTAEKKDSQGICFVGKVGIKEFLLHELGPQPHGAIVDEQGNVIGEHDGALFYTIGQRHGLDVGGGLPYYVVGKDMAKNEVYVTRQLDDDRLWLHELRLSSAHWIGGAPDTHSDTAMDGIWGSPDRPLQVRTRYRAPLVAVKRLEKINDAEWLLELAEPVRAVTPGQSAVFYGGDCCLGGAIVR
jgi:tRNA-specific 2-thiouridylase